MKKLVLLILGFVMFKTGYAQYPMTQFIGTDSAVVISKGAMQSRFINVVFADTTAANSQRIKQYPGAMIYASGKMWVRNTTATAWVELAYGPISSTNIYNSDGTLTGNRELDGNSNNLTFTAVRKFSLSGDSLDYTLDPAGNLRIGLGNQQFIMRADTASLSRRLSYTGNLGSSFTKHTLVDKNYVDSISFSGYVPYVGATQNVNLGQYGLKTEYVEFDTTLRAPADRTLSWNNDEGTLNLGMTNGGSLTQRIGLEQFARVRNVDTATISIGDAVYIFGASGDRASVKRASNKSDATSSKTLGVATENIAVGDVGFVGTFGVVSKLNLGSYTSGDILYLDSIPGKLTATKPQAPYHLVFIGVVERANNGNGLLFVNPQNGYELEELHNVRITSPVRNNGILAYDSVAQLWKDTTLSAIGGVTGSGTSGQVAYWTGSSSQSGSSTFLFSPTTELDLSQSVTASSAIARGIRLRPTLTAAANNDVLVGLDIAPTFTNGAFTGVRNFGLRVTTGNGVEAARFTSPSGQFLIMPRLSSIYGAYLQSLDAAGTATQPLSFSSNKFVFESGNVLINQTTDGGQRLQVNGDVLFKGSGNTSGTTALTVQNSSLINLLTVRNDGLTTLTGTTNNDLTAIFRIQQANGNGRFIVNAAGQMFVVGDPFTSTEDLVTIGRNSFNPTSGTTRHTTVLLNTVINQTGGANGITRGLYVNPTLTAAADWRSIEWSNNSGWGLYGAGSANNYLAGRLSIGTLSNISNNSFQVARQITGATFSNGMASYGPIQSDVTSEARYYITEASTQAATFTLAQIHHYKTAQGTFGAGSTVTNQFGFSADATLIGATNNFGFYGNIPSATGRWNLYMNGTAANYMNGNLLLGSTVDGGQKLQVTGNAIVNGTLSIDNTSFTGSAATLTKTANSTFRIQGSGIGDNITFGPTNRIFLNTNEVVAQATIAVGTSITGNIANSTGLLINNNQLTQSNDTRTGLTLMTKTWRNDGAGLTSTINAVQISPTADMTLGTTIGTVLLLNPIINTTGGTNTIRGIYYNPTLTSTTGTTHIAIQTVSGNVLFGTTSGNVGVGNTTPFSGATVNSSVELGAFSANNGNLIVRGYSSLGGLQNNAYGAVGSNYYLDASNALRRKNADLVSTLEFSSGFRFSTAGNGAANSVISLTELMRLNSNGNLLLGTTTDAGYKLDVNGTARFSQTTYITGGGLQVLGGMSSPTGNGGFELEYSAGIAYVTAYNRTSFSWVPINIRSSYTSFTTSNVERMRLVDGGLGIGTSSPNASAILELSSTTKGFLPPKMTGTEAEAIASPAAGLLVYITNGNGTTITSTGWWGYESSGWVKLN